ncbi:MULTISPECIES: L,D-transpeptidase [Chelatococcus]|uniref:Lipoprotein-anchoring transpeptidase ErfK/SrfK n=1 Tax=Chelatococcus caeni TaxID=1348468 RepID=A0A840BRR7_9HYPH|nr:MULTISPECIES: L,D-transpeptidase [Chelatococcus]MBB4015434.1 lipoprotein-anchoring transpeptidase ErfK/SrfK [Chelatococcus caeni]
MHSISRRSFLIGAPAALAACTTTAPPPVAQGPSIDPMYFDMYDEITTEPYSVPAVDLTQINPTFLRQVVSFAGPQEAGTIVVDPYRHFLYLVMEGGQAMRYGVGVGREGFGWSGNATIRRKAAWPTWTPPASMIRRQPELAEWAAGMPGGMDNPLGARALYLYQGDRDTLYRIHGTNEPWSIGQSVSSGCIRLINQDIIDLHRRVPIGTRVTVLSSGSPRVASNDAVAPFPGDDGVNPDLAVTDIPEIDGQAQIAVWR